jgi:hypothetical protein
MSGAYDVPGSLFASTLADGEIAAPNAAVVIVEPLRVLVWKSGGFRPLARTKSEGVD